MRRPTSIMAPAIGVFLIGALPALAQSTWHVDGFCGDDAWTGQSPVCQAPDGPKRTIGAGIAGAAGGDTVLVAPGVYSGPGNLDLYVDRALTLRAAAGPGSTTIDGSGAVSYWINARTPTGAVIDGFTATGFVEDTPIELQHEGEFTILNCRFIDNVGHLAGGIMTHEVAPVGVLKVYNCLFLRSSGWAGGIYNKAYDGDLEVANCTFVGGEGLLAGAVVSLAPARLANSIFRGEEPQVFASAPACTVSSSNVEGELGGNFVDAGGNIDADPLFADPGSDDFRLLPGSPCIDSADNSKVPDWLTTDFAGFPRFIDDPATQDTGVGPPPVVDMGAHEFQPGGCYPDFTGDGELDLFDFLAFVNAFNAVDPSADCDETGSFDLFDFLCFTNAFNAGC
jgi:hypothetical protein